MIDSGAAIQAGRRVRFFAGYGGIDSDGVIVDLHDEPGTAWDLGLGRPGGPRPIRVSVDVVLDDGRRLDRCMSIDRPGIGIKLLPEVVGADEVMAAKQRHAMWLGEQAIAKAKAKYDFEQAEAARVIPEPPIFYWNGIKDAKGAKLQRCSYSDGMLLNHPDGTITIYARDYDGFTAKVHDCFAVENRTDTQTDYFDHDTIRVSPAHPLYPQVKAALKAREAHYARRAAA